MSKVRQVWLSAPGLAYLSTYVLLRIDGVIGLTAAGAAMTKDGVGTAGCWENVTLCMTAR